MYSDLSSFTIVSITYNDAGIYDTIHSVEELRKSGARHIIQNGGDILENLPDSCLVFNEYDVGIYDALNKGLEKVESKFFMFLHAGDTFIGSAQSLLTIINSLEATKKSISLNSQYIGKRLHSSRLWKPWMINLGAQPPHLPTVYRTKTYNSKPYDLSKPIIGDFHFFKTNVNWSEYINHNQLLVQMASGGKTRSGYKSFMRLNNIYCQEYGIHGFLMVFARIPIKILQAIF
jgi:glycosyltransferase involved in cell wall biosynthesis